MFECGICVWKSEVVQRVDDLAKRVDDLANELSDVVVRVMRVEKSVDAMKVVKMSARVEVRQEERRGETEVSESGVDGNSVSETEMAKMGSKLGTLEKTLVEIGAAQQRLEELVEGEKRTRGLYSQAVSRSLQRGTANRHVSRVSSATGATGGRVVGASGSVVPIAGGMATDGAGGGAGVGAGLVL